MSPLSVGLGWVLFAALVLLLLAGWRLTLGLCRAAALTPQTHRPADANPSTGSAGRCNQDGCHYPATIWVIVHDKFGGGVRKVCVGCHHEGQAHGWWRRSLGTDANVYDLAIAGECEDIDQIEAYANGEAS